MSQRASDAPPSRFGRYRLLERIAVGATGEVFRALLLDEHADETPVAFKRLLPQRSKEQELRRSFFEEARILAALDHPNITRIVDFGETHGTVFLALELVDGPDLATLLEQRGRLPVAVAVHIALEVAGALDYIHRQAQQLVHQDVSPRNILISKVGGVKLTDFGIATQLNAGDAQVEQGGLKGTLDYLAPERANRAQRADSRADVFGLGAVLYHMLLGRPPFHAAAEADVLARAREGAYKLEERWFTPAGARLVPILRRALEPDPAQRYPSASELADDLRAFQAGRPRVDLAMWLSDGALREPPDLASRAALQLLGFPDRHTAVVSISLPPEAPEAPADGEPPSDLEVDEAPATSPLSPGVWRLLLAVAATAAISIFGTVWWLTRDATAVPSERAVAEGPRPAEVAAPTVPRAMSRLPGASTATPSLTALETRGPRSPLLAPRRRAPRPPEAPPGHISINSIPWGWVHVDGHAVGATPLVAYPLPPGRHRIELRGKDGRVLKEFVGVVKSGQTQVYQFDGSKP